ncbi:MAG: hypothetical protein GC152_04350 [Alphaproteobacteria bacterium]|nr:hypothetical protein [Alphaproteobacteria bacterium]
MTRPYFTAVIATGLFAGGALMVGLSFGIVFLGLGDLVPAMTGEQLVQLFPRYWLAIACAIIPIALVKTYALAASALAAPKATPVRRLWSWSLGLWLLNAAITAGYHVQVVIAAFMEKYSADEIVGVIELWVGLHWIRVAIALGSFLLAVLATARAAKD